MQEFTEAESNLNDLIDEYQQFQNTMPQGKHLLFL
jgi:hypothetical protein